MRCFLHFVIRLGTSPTGRTAEYEQIGCDIGMTRFRRLPLETLVNARDIGGYATMDGKVTKYGRFIRS
jgi:hypothetical protein